MTEPGSPMLSAMFSALADPTRREIITRLKMAGETTVGELAEPLAMSWPAVTKHLRVLEAAGLLERRRDGRFHWISFNPEPLASALSWIRMQKTNSWTAAEFAGSTDPGS